MLELDDARGRLAAAAMPLPALTVPLAEAAGCRLAAAPVADTDLPPFDASAMDGYACRAADLAAGGPLPIAFEVPAGALPPGLPPGSAARIFTGAPLPGGADTVVPQEQAEAIPGAGVRLSAIPAGSNVRRRGEVLARGAAVGAPGDPITPARLALLAAAGCARVEVVPRPRVAVVVTGNELLGAGEAPAPGRIRNSNGPLLEALCREADLALAASGTARDRVPELVAALAGGADRAELVIATGGVSVGDYDLVPAAVAQLGGEIVLHGVAVQPGKPVLVARLGRAWLIGLPGNPVSVLVGWRVFARPLAEAIAGDGQAFGEVPLAVTLLAPARNSGPRVQLRPARLRRGPAGFEAEVIRWRGSHDVAAAARAEALVRLEPGAVLDAGAPAVAFPLPWRLTR